ncbi:MAG: hypothetical protein OEY59_04315 [Deltaproteobacteria bacterium]|nr:hypothetical protein [Deltaproteobacteria bacterium]
MRTRILYICLMMTISVLLGANTTLAFPKYTDSQTAMELAKMLDGGSFGRLKIASTYVQNDSHDKYFISVILSDGSAHKWYLNEIYKWTRDDKIKLKDNKALLFLEADETDFVPLDKNKFHKIALEADVFIKTFKGKDPLSGQQFRYKVKTFNLIAPHETFFGRDKTGSKYRYILDLFNGTTELLTYEDAYEIMQNGYLLDEAESKQPTLTKAYKVEMIKPNARGFDNNGVSQFGIEVFFDQDIILGDGHFPFEIYEKKTYNKRTKRTTKDFVIDITIPNSELGSSKISGIESLKYLHDIKVVKNTKYPKRLFLRTAFNPIVMDLPPVIYKNRSNSIYVTFFDRIDQSIESDVSLKTENILLREEKESEKIIEVKKKIEDEDPEYRKAYQEATSLKNQADSIKGNIPQINKMLESVKKFEEAALYAKTDSQLYNALGDRNRLRDEIINLTVNHIVDKLSKDKPEVAEINEMKDLLNQADSFTGKNDKLKQIDQLRKKLDKLKSE